MNFVKHLIFTILLSISILSIAQKNTNSFTFNQIDSVYQYDLLKFREINLTDINFMILNDCKLNEIETDINYLDAIGFERFFDFKNQNQINVYQNITNFNIQIKQTRVILNQYLSNLDFWFHKLGQDFLYKNDTCNTVIFIEKSLCFNKLYIPSLQLKSSILTSKNSLIEASLLFREIGPFIFQNNTNYNLFQTTILQISNKFEEKAESSYKTGYYNESLELYQNADSFCTTFNSLNCEIFKNGIAKSKTGLYHSYLKISKQALNTQNYSIAESFTDKALEYANQNRDAIKTDTETDNIYRLILSKYISISTKHKRNDNYKSSSAYERKAKKICELLKIEDCTLLFANQHLTGDLLAGNKELKTPENIEYQSIIVNKETINVIKANFISNKIKDNKKKSNKTRKKSSKILASQPNRASNAVYTSLIEIGNEYFSNAKYEEAYQKFSTAKSMDKNNNNLDNLLIKTSREIINTHLHAADFLIWANELRKADSIYLYSIKLQKKYQLENDQITNSILFSFQEKIQIKKCNNIQDQINNLNQKTNTLLGLNDYTKAQSTINEANEIYKQNTNCKLDDTETSKIQGIIKPITLYFSLKDKAKEFYQINNLQLFTTLFYKADSLYKNARLDTFKIVNSNLIAFLIFNNNEKANLYALEYFLNNNQYDYSLQIMNILKNNGSQSINTKESQQKIANIIYKTNKPEVSELKNNYSFLKDEKWFKYFFNEYKKLINNQL